MSKNVFFTESQMNFICEVKGGTTSNKHPMVSINEAKVKRMLGFHSKYGYAIVSASRQDYSELGIDTNLDNKAELRNQENKNRSMQLLNDIKKAGFADTPTYGSVIENLVEDNQGRVWERSFFIYCKDKNGNPMSFDSLFNFAITMCGKYGQDSVLICKPNGTPTYYTKDGDIDFELGNDVVYNDPSQMYYTDLHKNTDKYGDKLKDMAPTRFSFVCEGFINPAPVSASENFIRRMRGEMFITE